MNTIGTNKQDFLTTSYLTQFGPKNDRFLVEAEMVRRGGKFTARDGKEYGNGLYWHYKAAMSALWPNFWWHIWSELLVESWCTHDECGVMGPASSGKTYTAAAWAYVTLQIWPQNTTVLMSTTTRDGLQLRVWGSIKELHRKAKERRPWLSGRIIESKYMLTTSGQDGDTEDGTDFRDGIIGISCRVGGTFVGLANYVGIKNDRVILIADEASLMARGFLDSISNLRKNPYFKFIAMGNPKDRNDALGVVCEPHHSIGGWEALDYKEETRTWPARGKNSIAIQICGYDTPNGQPPGNNPYPNIITPEQIETDLQFYGKDSLQFSMMNLGCMPKDGGNRRVITINLCEQSMAFEEPAWSGEKQTHAVGLDPAYSGTGGDRCVLTDLIFGTDVEGNHIISFAEPQTIVPVNPASTQQAEEQIVEYVMNYCTQRNIPPDNVGFDSTGRSTVMSAFARMWSAIVTPIEFGGKPTNRAIGIEDQRKEDDIYGKMVTALWFASRLLIEGKQMRKMSRECAEEGSYREWTVINNGKIDVEPKIKTKERMGRSPDLYDSFVVALEKARRLGFQITGGKRTTVAERATPRWVTEKRNRVRDLEKSKQLVYQ